MAFRPQRGGSGDEEDRPIVEAGRQERPSSSDRSYGSLRAGDPNNSLENPLVIPRRTILGLVLLSVVALLIIESIRLHEVDHKTDIMRKASFNFAILVIFNAVYIMGVATHGIVYEHVEQMVGFFFAYSVLFVYVLIDFILHKKNGTADTLKTVGFALVTTAFCILIGLACCCVTNPKFVKLWKEKEGMRTLFCRLESLLCFDFQLAVSLVILVLHRGNEVDRTEAVILAVGLIYCLEWAIAGYFVTRYETKKGTIVFMLLSVLLLGYIIYKFVYIGQHWHEIRRKGTHELAIVFIVAAVLSIVIRCLLVYAVYKVFKNFGKGLWTPVTNSYSVQEEGGATHYNVLLDQNAETHLTTTAFCPQRGGSGDEEDRPSVAAGCQERRSSSGGSYQPLRDGDPTQDLNNRNSLDLPRRTKAVRRYEKKWEGTFLILVQLSGVALLIFESIRLHEVDHKTDIKSKASFTFAILVIFNAVYIMVVATHGIVYEHLEQMVGFFFASSVLFAYVLYDFIMHKKTGTADTLKTVRFALVTSAFCILSGLACYCLTKPKFVKPLWNDKEDKYTLFCRMESLLFFDFQLAASLFILVLHRGNEVNSTETAILTVGLIYCLEWAIAGYFVTRYETKKGTSVFMLLSVLLLVYIIYKFVFIGRHWHDIQRKGTHDLAYAFIGAAVLSFVIRCLLMYAVYKVYTNFGKGLWIPVKNSNSEEEEEVLGLHSTQPPSEMQGESSSSGDDAA